MSAPEVMSTPSPPSPPASAPGAVARLGRALLAPRRAALALVAGEPGGLSDVLWLVPLRLLTGETAQFVRDDSRSLLLGLLQALSIDLLGIFLGGVLMSLILGRREGRLRSGLTADVTAHGWLAWLLVQTLAALTCAILQYTPSPALLRGISYVALSAWGLHWLVSLLSLRSLLTGSSPATAATEEDLAAQAIKIAAPAAAARSSLRFAWGGGLFLAALGLLAVYDGSWLLSKRAQTPRAGKQAPTLVVPQLDGNSDFDLAAQSGHPVLIDFWATWCGPCKESLPIVDRVYKRLQGEGLRAIAIETSGDVVGARAFARRFGLGLPIGMDNGDAAAHFHVSSIPHLVLVDRNGLVRRVFHGVHGEGEIEAAVRALK